MWPDMKNICYKYLSLFLFVLLWASCSEREHEVSQAVTFDVGFERFKTDQGIVKGADGKEEVYFLKARFNPCLLFYDLEGNRTDSISLQSIAKKYPTIGRATVLSKDTVVLIMNGEKHVVGMKRDNTLLFDIDLLSLSSDEKNNYFYMGSFLPTPIIKDNALVLISVCEGRKSEVTYSSYFEYIYDGLERYIHSPLLCKVDSLFGTCPTLQYGLHHFYYDKHPEVRGYYVTGGQYAIVNDFLFFLSAHDRNIYRMDWETMTPADTIEVIPQQYAIPEGIIVRSERDIDADPRALEEIREKCVITNLLYDDRTRQYYVFLRTAPDDSPVDEYGYPFNIYVYDESFRKVKTLSVKSDLYNPKGAMMTSRGLMIERTPRDKEYGKRTFEFWNL